MSGRMQRRVGLGALLGGLLWSLLWALWPAVALADGPAGRPDLFRLVLAPREDGWVAVVMAEYHNTASAPWQRLVLPIPPGAQSIQVVEGGSPERTVPEGDLLADLDGLEPGESRTLIATYQLPAEEADLTLRFPHGVDSILVAVPDGIQIYSGQLEAAGVSDLNGAQFRTFTASVPLEPGQKLRLQVSLPGGGAGAGGAGAPDGAPAQPPAGGPEIGHTHGGTTGKVVANLVFILVAIFLAITGTALVGRRLLAPAPSRPASDRSSLVERIAALDLEFRDGRLAEAAYRPARFRLKEQLLAVARVEVGRR